MSYTKMEDLFNMFDAFISSWLLMEGMSIVP